MNILQNIIIARFLALLFIGCAEKTEIELDSDSLIGFWINPRVTDSVVTYSKSNNLIENNYGISFYPDGTIIERKYSGWCATPPITYSDFNGSWNKTDSLVSIEVDYWGGNTSYRWEIIELKDNKLVVHNTKQEYNSSSGLLCDQGVIISPKEYDNEPNDPFSITEMIITGDCLTIRFSASGCDGNSWIVKLIDSGNVAESYPNQRTLRLSLDNNEICNAVPIKEVSFDISDLQIVGDDKVILHVSSEEILYEY